MCNEIMVYTDIISSYWIPMWKFTRGTSQQPQTHFHTDTQEDEKQQQQNKKQ